MMYWGLGFAVWQFAFVAPWGAVIIKRAEQVTEPRAGEGVKRVVLGSYYPKETAADDANVQSLNMVMTHDSGAVPTKLYPADHGAVCQGKGLVEQFEAGVTIFDFRMSLDGHLVHEWFLVDRKFGRATEQAQALANAVKGSDRFAILLIKGKGTPYKQLKEEFFDRTDIFYGRKLTPATTVGEVKNKLVFLNAGDTETHFFAKKLQLGLFEKVMSFTPTYTQMATKYKDKCKANHVPGQDKQLIKASFSNAGIYQSPLCQTVTNLPTIQTEMQNLFNGECPVVVSVDAGAELLSSSVGDEVVSACCPDNGCPAFA